MLRTHKKGKKEKLKMNNKSKENNVSQNEIFWRRAFYFLLFLLISTNKSQKIGQAGYFGRKRKKSN